MRTKAKFEKVTLETYLAANCPPESYENIKLPRRATAHSAGYDFFTPQKITLGAGQTVTVPTGIRALMPNNWVLLLFPRSGLGFKYKLRLDNTVGVIDADYSNSDNEGHIFIRMTNESGKPLNIEAGAAFAQGIFTEYMLTEDDCVTDERHGGLGSTDVSGK